MNDENISNMTTGLWEVEGRPDESKILIMGGDDGICIAEIPFIEGVITGDTSDKNMDVVTRSESHQKEAWANARMIGALPQILADLRKISGEIINSKKLLDEVTAATSDDSDCIGQTELALERMLDIITPYIPA